MLEVRAYSTWEAVHHDAIKFPRLIQKLALFDASYSFPSYDVNDIIDFMSKLFAWVDKVKFKEHFGFSIEDIITVTLAINNNAPENGPYIFYVSAIKRVVKMLPEAQLQAILGRLSHISAEVNKGYQFADGYENLDFGFKPLIRLAKAKFILCDKSWCAMGFYEVLASLIREIDSYKDECNNKVGVAIEQYVYQKLAEKNIAFSNGRYADGSRPDGEADIVIEAAKKIHSLK